MGNRVLFVDDEVSLLNGIKRRLGTQIDLVTACSGDEGLIAIGEQGPFAVVVTDMRMPKMDGIQFVQAARAKSPNTVFIMLTGNQDQATAIQALNDGHVFRFLNKPCQSQDLLVAIEAGLRQHQLIISEKELLQGTFVGAVSVLTDVLELAQPRIFGHAERVQEIVTVLQQRLRLEDRWEYKLAARLSLLGFALLPEQDRVRFEMGLDTGRQLHDTIRAAAAIGQRVIERIPRLETVARVIGLMGSIDGNMLLSKMRTDDERAITGATLLRVAIEWDFLVRQGLSPEAAVDEIRKSLPNLHVTVATLLAEMDPGERRGNTLECDPADLVEGMVLQDDVLTGDGTILIRRGRRLTWTIIEKLRSYETSDVRLNPISVQTANAPAEEPVLV
jgi:DNA-binding response OmpR family regulator